MLKKWNDFNKEYELFSFIKKKLSETEIYENKLLEKILQILNDENGILRKDFHVDVNRDIISHNIYRYEFIYRPTIITITKESVELQGELNISDYKFRNNDIAIRLFKIAKKKYEEYKYNLKLEGFNRLKIYIDNNKF